MSEATQLRAPSHRLRARHLGPERRRPQVLDAAKAIALAHGMSAVTIGEVARTLGVTRPVVYSCYPDRVAIITALLDREKKSLIEGVSSAYPTPGRYTSTRAAYVGGTQALLRAVSKQPDTWRVLFCASPGRDIAGLFAQGRRQMADKFADIIAQDLERWGVDDPANKLPVLVEMFISMAEGAVRSLLRDDNPYTPEDLGEIIGLAGYRAIRQA